MGINLIAFNSGERNAPELLATKRTMEIIVMSDNVAVLEGFTREILIETHDRVIFALVKPDTLFTDYYRAWDTDAQDFVKLNGRKACWNMAYAELVE